MLDQAVALAAEYGADVDRDHTAEVARREHADDLVPELRRRGSIAGGDPGPRAVEELAIRSLVRRDRADGSRFLQ